MIDNGNFRIGTGSQNSINTSGNLVQPWYKGIDGGMYKLTYSNYPLDIAFGGGTGSNWTGSHVSYDPVIGGVPLTGQTTDYSGFNITATLPGNGVKGYGTIVTRGMLSGTGLSGLELQHTYILGRDANFLKVITQIRNTNATATGNTHMWIGTRDDYINLNDRNLKWKGNVVDGVFTRNTAKTEQAQMVQISNPTEGALFYSTTPGTDMAIASCCSFANVYDLNPTSSEITLDNDGSYAIYQLLGQIPAGGTRFVTWYYAAAPLVNLAAVTAALGAAGAPGALAGNGQATITWSEPSTETPITSYVIRYTSDNGTSWTNVPVSPVPNPLSRTITGLANGTTYRFQVAPVTAAGQGVFSNSSPAITPGMPANIGAPTVRGGRPFVGATLSVNDPNSNWINNGSQAMTASYQWQANNVDIPGATGTTFAVTSAYLGQVIRVRASRTNEVGTTSVFSSATLSVAPTPANFPPVPTDQTLSTRQGIARSVTLSGTDQENSTLTYQVTIQPINGTLSGTAPNLTYTPNAGFTGTDFFLFRVNDGAQNSGDDATITINVFPRPTQLELAVAPVPGASGAAMTTAPVIRFLDAGGNVINGLNDPVTVSIHSGAGGTLSGTTTVNAFNGVASFNGLALSGLVGTNYVLRFSEGALTVDSASITPSGPGTAVALALTTAPVPGPSGAAMTVQPVLMVRDSAGNQVPGWGTPVTVAIQSGSGGTLSGTQSVSASTGVATFSGLGLAGLVGTNYVLRFTSPGLTQVDSGNLTVTPGAPTQLAITTAPTAVFSGSPLTTQPVAEIRDAQGNWVTSSTAAVTIAIQSGAGG
ncbi:MAG: Ig-like domain-containing protein, partial [Blastocatellia bacterium]